MKPARDRKQYLNTIWTCISVSLILLVLSGFAFLLMNFFHNKIDDDDIGPGGGHLDSILTIDYQIPNHKGHTYDTGETEKPKNVDGNNKLFSENEPIRLQIISRHEWLAHPARKKHYFNVFSIEKAIILETGTESCNTTIECASRVREIQKKDLQSGRDDITYNFLIGGDGSTFEGRGLSVVGDHTKDHNSNSWGIALIGKYDRMSPTEAQIVALRSLLQFGIANEHLKSNYELYGHSQLSNHQNSKNPGVKLYEIIQKWPHWTENNFYTSYKT